MNSTTVIFSAILFCIPHTTTTALQKKSTAQGCTISSWLAELPTQRIEKIPTNEDKPHHDSKIEQANNSPFNYPITSSYPHYNNSREFLLTITNPTLLAAIAGKGLLELYDGAETKETANHKTEEDTLNFNKRTTSRVPITPRKK